MRCVRTKNIMFHPRLYHLLSVRFPSASVVFAFLSIKKKSVGRQNSSLGQLHHHLLSHCKDFLLVMYFSSTISRMPESNRAPAITSCGSSVCVLSKCGCVSVFACMGLGRTLNTFPGFLNMLIKHHLAFFGVSKNAWPTDQPTDQPTDKPSYRVSIRN